MPEQFPSTDAEKLALVNKMIADGAIKPPPTPHELAATDAEQQTVLDTHSHEIAENTKKLGIATGWAAFVQTPIGKAMIALILVLLGQATLYFTGLLQPPAPHPPTPPVQTPTDTPPKVVPKVVPKVEVKSAARSSAADDDNAAYTRLASLQPKASAPPAGKMLWKVPGPFPRGRGRKVNDAHRTLRMAWSNKTHGEMLKKLRTATAASYDCRTLGQDTADQDQGQCGDCYAFSGTEVVACAQLTANVVSLQTTPAFQMSVQWTLDCQNFGGCNGGDEWQVAQQYLVGSGTGGPSLAQYPGAGQNPSRCGTFSGTTFTVTNMGYCDPNQQANGVASTQLIKNVMVAYGPISVAVAAGSWGDPGSTPITGSDSNIDHAIMLVGWDDNVGGGCWIMKNSWGTGWGMSGYAYIAYGADSVGTEAFWCQAQGTTPPTPPPPPVPPVPPGPTPGPGSTITFSLAGQQAVTYTVLSPATLKGLQVDLGLVSADKGVPQCCGQTPAPVIPAPVPVVPIPPVPVTPKPVDPPVVIPPPIPVPPRAETPAEAMTRSIKTMTPIVLFQNVPARRIDGCITVYIEGLGVQSGDKAILVCLPSSDGYLQRFDLPASADDSMIRSTIASPPKKDNGSFRPVVQPAPTSTTNSVWDGYFTARK